MIDSHGLAGWRFAWKHDAPEQVDGGTWESHGHVDFERRFIFLNDRYALDPSFDVTNAILHEISHAKVGPGHGHDSMWLSVAKRIGVKDPHPEDRPKRSVNPGIRHDIVWILPKEGEAKGHWERAKPPLSW
jgi:hypothetical protein